MSHGLGEVYEEEVHDEGAEDGERKLGRQSDREGGQVEAKGRHRQRNALEASSSDGPQACSQPGNCRATKGGTESIQVGRTACSYVTKGSCGSRPQVPRIAVVEVEARPVRNFPSGIGSARRAS